MSQLSFFAGSEAAIPYERVPRQRRSRSRGLTIKVHPDGRVRVIAPRYYSERAIRQAVRDKAEWINHWLSHYEQQRRHLPQPAARSGDILLYLGEPLTLNLITGDNVRPRIQRAERQLQITVADTSPENIRKGLANWKRREAKRVFAERTAEVASNCPWVSALPPLTVRKMRSQWGSCSSRGRINLNLHLISTPPACLDYVIAHELCHLKEMNHSERYYRLLDALMPDWRIKKEALNEFTGLLLLPD